MPTPREREMRSLLAQLDNSALSTRDFADLHGMSVMTIYWWRSELRRRDRERDQDFVEVDIRPDTAIAAPQAFEIVLPCGLRIVVPRAYDADELRQLIAAVSTC
ncbi:MAG: hypothetical protein H6832_17595 [Planctomycetes bacterium]|nr:hypothetical protein [Planctomycetota bacterium]